MNEESAWPLGIQRKWIEGHGAEVINAIKAGYGSGLIERVPGPKVVGRKKSDAARAAEDQESIRLGRRPAIATLSLFDWARATEDTEFSGNGSSDSMDGARAAVRLPIVKEEPRDSGHFYYGPSRRREIAREYRRARDAREFINKDSWAQSKYGITGKTLLSYEREFPEET